MDTCSGNMLGEDERGDLKVWQTVEEFCYFTKEKGFFMQRRMGQYRQVMTETIEESLKLVSIQGKILLNN